MRGIVGSLAVGCALALLAPCPGASRAGDGSWAADPVYVFYPRADCRGEQIQVQVWDRARETWRAHPGHPRVPVDSCQLEDAGNLLNELRVRCVEPPDSEPPPGWVVGLDVFDPEVMERCGTRSIAGRSGDLQLQLLEPAPGERVALPRLEVPVLGALRTGGMEGTSYDVSLVIDRSAAIREGDRDHLAAQVQAARAWLAQLAPRLGPVRVGIVEYPNLPPIEGEGSAGARRVVGFSDDPFELEDALAAVRARGTSGFQTTATALEFAKSELLGRNPGSRARHKARKLLVLVSNALAERSLRSQLGEGLRRVHEAGVTLHLFAIGGLSEALEPETRALLEHTNASFQRVSRDGLAAGFLSRVELPFVTRVVVANRTTGGAERPAELLAGGRFRSALPVTPGTNRLVARATLSDGETVLGEWDFEFDDRVVKELILAAEREHMRRIREKQLEVQPQWQEPLPPGAVMPPPPE